MQVEGNMSNWEQNQEKWAALERTAKCYLEFGAVTKTKRPVDLIFHLEIYPSFDGQTGWTVYYAREPIRSEQPIKGIDAHVERVVWDDKADRERRRNLPPDQFDSKPTLLI